MDYTEIEQVVSDEWIIAKMQEFGLLLFSHERFRE